MKQTNTFVKLVALSIGYSIIATMLLTACSTTSPSGQQVIYQQVPVYENQPLAPKIQNYQESYGNPYNLNGYYSNYLPKPGDAPTPPKYLYEQKPSFRQINPDGSVTIINQQ